MSEQLRLERREQAANGMVDLALLRYACQKSPVNIIKESYETQKISTDLGIPQGRRDQASACLSRFAAGVGR